VPTGLLQKARSSPYEQEWSRLAEGGPLARRRRARIEAEFAAGCARFGYDVTDLRARQPWRWNASAGA
jgi:hypothetical protein